MNLIDPPVSSVTDTTAPSDGPRPINEPASETTTAPHEITITDESESTASDGAVVSVMEEIGGSIKFTV